MPNSALTEALKQAYASARSDQAILQTVQLHHPLVADDFYLVADLTDKVMTLETDDVVTFEACSFRLQLPTSGENGIQALSLSVDNVDQRISDFIEVIKNSQVKTEVTYRPYLSTDLSAPARAPLVLYLSDIVATAVDVSGKASFGDVINKKFPTALYTRRRFPSLGNL